MGSPKYAGCYNCSFTGDAEVGKTCLALAKSGKDFSTEHEPTVFENYAADVTVGNQRFLMGLFDNASETCYEPLRAFAYEKSDVFLLCYSVVKRSSFENIKSTWLPELRRYINKRKPILLVGLKTDLRSLADGTTCVSTEEGKQLANEIGAVNFLECSALTRNGLNEVFDEVMRLMISSTKKRKTFALFRSLRHHITGIRVNTSRRVRSFLGSKNLRQMAK